MPKLIEITIVAFKTFYVEAESEDDALSHPAVDDETRFSFGDFDWEHDETTAKEMDEKAAAHIRTHHPKKIVQEE